jgi:hypothetical protein
MALQFVLPPPAVLSTYQQSLVDLIPALAVFLDRGIQEAETLLGKAESQGWNLNVHFYHLPVGTLGLEELAKGATLQDVVLSGWRFYASWPDGSMDSCEMTEPTIDVPAVFRNHAKGDPVTTSFARIQEAQGLAAVQAGDFELHFLGVPGIHLEALHLVSPAGDLVLPVLSFDSQLATNAVLDATTFIATAQAIASARLALALPSPLST